MIDRDAKDGMSAHIFPMGDAKEPLAAPVHCLHLSVWVGTVVKLSNLQHCQNCHLAFGACDILAVFKLDLPGGLSEVSKASPSCSPEHIVGNRLVRRLWKEDRQVSQVSRLV